MEELLVVGDRVLIAPDQGEERTATGLVLPASVRERDKVHGGRVVRTGPGYLMPNAEYSDEPWSRTGSPVRYLPLQAQRGDYAFFVRAEAVEITFRERAYLIVPHRAILALVRPEEVDLDALLENVT